MLLGVEPTASGRYFGAVGTLFNTWREHFAQINSCWGTTFGHEAGVETCKRMQPMAIVARWLSLLSCEDYLLARNANQIKEVLSAVIMKADHAQEARPARVDAAAVGGGYAASERDGYHRRLGKWRNGSVDLLRNPSVFPVIQSFNVVHQRLGHPLTWFFARNLQMAICKNSSGIRMTHLSKISMHWLTFTPGKQLLTCPTCRWKGGSCTMHAHGIPHKLLLITITGPLAHATAMQHRHLCLHSRNQMFHAS